MKCLAFDASPLVHFARAGLLSSLETLTAAWRRGVAASVLDEIADGVERHPELATIAEQGWLETVSVVGLDGLRVFSAYAQRLGSGQRDIGEAETLAWRR